MLRAMGVAIDVFEWWRRYDGHQELLWEDVSS